MFELALIFCVDSLFEVFLREMLRISIDFMVSLRPSDLVLRSVEPDGFHSPWKWHPVSFLGGGCGEREGGI